MVAAVAVQGFLFVGEAFSSACVENESDLKPRERGAIEM